MAPASTGKSRRFRRVIGPDARRFIAGVLLIAVITYGQQVYGMMTASQRLDPSLRGATGPSNVVVVLDFMPERFHNERAVYLARAHGLRAFGFDAQEVGGFEGTQLALRELVSRVFALLDVNVFHTKPHFEGPREALPPAP